LNEVVVADEEFIGPPQDRPWDGWSDEQKAHFEHALQLAEGIKLYHSAGGIGVGAEYAPHAAALHKRGGLTQEEATNLARYRMWKMGMQNIPTGERAPAPTDEEIGARREAFIGGSPAVRNQMMREDKAAIDRGHEAYFDSLIHRPDPRVATVDGVPMVTAYADPAQLARAQGAPQPDIPLLGQR
jgi:hypothetical protein